MVSGRFVDDHGVGPAVYVIDEIQRGIAVGLSQQLTACVDVVVDFAADGLCAPGTVLEVVSEGKGLSTTGCGSQISSVAPTEGPPGAVIIAGGIAGIVVGDTLPVKLRQQVAPLVVTVGGRNNRWKERKLPPSVTSRKRENVLLIQAIHDMFTLAECWRYMLADITQIALDNLYFRYWISLSFLI